MTSRQTRNRSLAAAGLLLTVTMSGCTGLWLLVQDEEGLPCAPDGACNAGFVCIEEQCRRAEATPVGEPCTIDTECETRICADAYDPAECFDTLSCVTINRAEADFRCRAPCNPADATQNGVCGDGERCHTGLNRPPDRQSFCQQGVCDVDTDCGVNNDLTPSQQNICFAAGVNTGEAGLCTRGCDPLQCRPDTGCEGCGATEPSCESFQDGTERFGCLPSGLVPFGGECDFANNFCVPGAFCHPQGFCAKFCNANGGAPACEGQDFCNPLQGVPGVGFCG